MPNLAQNPKKLAAPRRISTGSWKKEQFVVERALDQFKTAATIGPSII